jgi:hypothetical protein
MSCIVYLKTLPQVQKVQRWVVRLQQVLNWKRSWPILIPNEDRVKPRKPLGS